MRPEAGSGNSCMEPVSYTHLVLNSVSLLERSFPILDRYERVNCYLDRDEAGRRTLEAVSYTHLDVYKRQLQISPDFLAKYGIDKNVSATERSCQAEKAYRELDAP